MTDGQTDQIYYVRDVNLIRESILNNSQNINFSPIQFLTDGLTDANSNHRVASLF